MGKTRVLPRVHKVQDYLSLVPESFQSARRTQMGDKKIDTFDNVCGIVQLSTPFHPHQQFKAFASIPAVRHRDVFHVSMDVVMKSVSWNVNSQPRVFSQSSSVALRVHPPFPKQVLVMSVAAVRNFLPFDVLFHSDHLLPKTCTCPPR